ncbi:MAG: DUF4175 family protein [Pseudomonadota bacterium]
MPKPSTSLGFKAALFAARLTTFLERLWPHFWPFLPVLTLFCAFGLLGVWQVMPLWLHIPALLALMGLAGFTAKGMWQSVLVPSREEGLARLERHNELAFQPLRKSLQGQAVHGQGASQALWQAHLARLAKKAATVEAPRAQLSWLGQDRFALTAVAALTLITGLFAAGSQTGERLKYAFLPSLGGAPAQVDMVVEAIPPSYTGLPPILLTAFQGAQGERAKMVFPAGTMLDMTLEGGWRTPRLAMAGQETPFEDIGNGRYRLRRVAPAAEGFDVLQGARTQFTWPGAFATDRPPQIGFADMPERSASDALSFSFDVSDDYGLARTALFLRPQDRPAAPERFEVPTPSIAPGETEKRQFFKDLTASQWAGRPVQLVLEAWDGLDQKGTSETIEVILPERAFNHPFARDIVQQRKRLFFENGSRLGVANWLNDASRSPARFDDSLWAFSMLRSAHYRLMRHDEPPVVDAVTAQMWEIATYLEDGGVSQDRAAMREALEDMMSALEAQDSEKFDALSRELEAKIADLMAKQMQMARGETPPQGIDGGEMRMIDSSTLERMMQQMRDLAASGDMAGAMEMLQAIQSLMENLSPGSGPSQELMEQAQAGQDALEDLNALIEDQRTLMNQTVRQALDGVQQSEANRAGPQDQSGPPSGTQGAQQGGNEGPNQGSNQGEGSYSALQGQQSGLEQTGQSLGQRLSDAGVPLPTGLDDANANMGQAAQRLGQERGLPALRAQAEALRNLENAQQALESQVEEMMNQIRSQSAGRDPFGRPDGRSLSNGQVKIPTEAEAKRARQIRDELQRRLGDPDRSRLERSYFRRLLEQFSR